MTYTFAQSLALLVILLVVATEFLVSGKNHLRKPEERGKSLGIGTVPTIILGLVEVLAGSLFVLGVYVAYAAAALMLIMLGAIFLKVFIWKKGFYSQDGYGWQYDLSLFAGSLIVFTFDAGPITAYLF